MLDLLKKSAMEQSKALKNKEVSAVELTKASIERIKSVDEKLGAFNSLTEDTAIETAKKLIKMKNVTKEQITEATGLSIKQIEELK